jgi:hypothetical protein
MPQQQILDDARSARASSDALLHTKRIVDVSYHLTHEQIRIDSSFEQKFRMTLRRRQRNQIGEQLTRMKSPCRQNPLQRCIRRRIMTNETPKSTQHLATIGRERRTERDQRFYLVDRRWR